MKAGDCPSCVFARLGSPVMEPPTPPGGMGRIVGSPLDEVEVGMEVAVDDGYIMEDVMLYGFCPY